MTRSRRRTARKKERQTSPYFNIPYHRHLHNPWPPYEIAEPAQIEAIHSASMHILENTGLRFLDEEVLALWAAAGAKVSYADQHVWPDQGLIMELIAQAPAASSSATEP